MTGLEKGFTGDGEPGPDTGPQPFFPGPNTRQGTAPQQSTPPPHTGPTPQSGPSAQSGPLPAPPAAVVRPFGAPRSAGSPRAGGPGRPAPESSALTSGANALPMTLQGSSGDISAPVEGRVTVGDEVIGKIAGIAAREVGGISALVERPGAGGVRVAVAGEEITLDVSVAVEYGTVIQDVAKVVQANVARVTGLMVGMRVVAVNVSVEDVRVPSGHAAARA
ncbi:Asp23/Gls24 family envelope stress response protein [Actinomadura syzygii]|nr:Asp23/Gls24 family envelope stress response protein [Actinomadura syzygii]